MPMPCRNLARRYKCDCLAFKESTELTQRCRSGTRPAARSVGANSGLISPANHGTATEFLERLPALQKTVRIFHFEEQHTLDMLLVRIFLRPCDADVNSCCFL